MQLKKRWLLLTVLLIGAIASLEVAPRSVVIKMTLPATSSCPCNDSPYGTSKFLDLLRGHGFDVVIVPSLADLNLSNLSRYDNVVVLAVAPTNLSGGYPDKIFETLEPHTRRLIIAVFDEYPPDGEADLISKAEERLCGSGVGVVIAKLNPSNGRAVVHFADGTELESGYTSYLSYKGTDQPIAVYNKPTTGQRLPGGLILQASVWPSSGQKSDIWTPLAATCSGPAGGVVVVADSSILINAALDANVSYGIESMRLINTTLTNGRTAVVILEDMYATSGVEVARRIHPSFLIIGVGRAYSSLEGRVLNALYRSGFGGLLALLVGGLIMLSTWASSNAATGMKGERRRAKARRQVLASEYRGSCGEVIEGLGRYDISRLIQGTVDPALRAEAERLYRVAVSGCKRGYLDILFPFRAARREAEAYRAYRLLLALLGLKPAVEGE